MSSARHRTTRGQRAEDERMRRTQRRPLEQPEHQPAQPKNAEGDAGPSMRPARDGSLLSSIDVRSSSTTTAASGTLTKNAARQLRCCTSQPPTTGPIAVVIALNPEPRADRAPAFCAVVGRADDREAARHEESRADPLQRTSGDEDDRVRCESAQHRRGV